MFDYRTNNTTDWVRFSSVDYAGFETRGAETVFSNFFFGTKNTFQEKNHTTFSLGGISGQKIKDFDFASWATPCSILRWTFPLTNIVPAALTDFQTQN